MPQPRESAEIGSWRRSSKQRYSHMRGMASSMSLLQPLGDVQFWADTAGVILVLLLGTAVVGYYLCNIMIFGDLMEIGIFSMLFAAMCWLGDQACKYILADQDESW